MSKSNSSGKVSGNSLKALDKKIAKRRQVYRPILDNPYTNEGKLWPIVEDQHIVWELLQSTILSKCKNLTIDDEWPWDISYSFNDIVSILSGTDESNSPVLLFVCNKDAGVPSVLLQQVPLLCYTSKVKVTLVQLPRNSLQVILDSLPIDNFDGMLLLKCNSKINSNFTDLILSKVAPLNFPWLDNLKYEPSNIKYLNTSMPIVSKNDNKNKNKKKKDEKTSNKSN
ncbi:hypothetical protein Kpol_1054p10 [Vanderwaltozyma polyspora DSM 70294]|uniref:Uncharacterized protein n=1 Tax=Vanderwaltozyma polyspora (strain ATCC 22028 / DSM 70294 / BCRC 21397 / CBS 2163 / NBRC 10782 / NRRL Y-8283 / UCD 57-17) TaxID=436907 RepID=A7TI98_VANPO|nr:uncharacterized protein Kpol_1054p10 [Vanderwaltozyma polyspora DSM 70294]EDO17964.1 hypothetical protein Kpol_1054p10 [Vanderwaltozyma polyspora DSM 70294]